MYIFWKYQFFGGLRVTRAVKYFWTWYASATKNPSKEVRGGKRVAEPLQQVLPSLTGPIVIQSLRQIRKPLGQAE